MAKGRRAGSSTSMPMATPPVEFVHLLMTSTTAQGKPAGAPEGVYGGTESIPGNLGASLGGTFVPFSDEVLSQRYPTKGAYITLVVRSAFQLLDDRYILLEDVIRYIVNAWREAP